MWIHYKGLTLNIKKYYTDACDMKYPTPVAFHITGDPTMYLYKTIANREPNNVFI